MNCASRTRRPRHANTSEQHEPIELRPRVVAMFRLADDTVCHTRCGRPLTFQGVRGLLEADFYCYACVTHVTIPLAVLPTLPVANAPGELVVTGAR